MCRDFNPAQTECGLALAKVYLGFGMFRNALEEAELLLKTEKKDRVMLNHFKDRQCDIPLLMIELLIQKEKLKVLSANEAKYFLLMVRVALLLIVFLFGQRS